MIKFKIFNIETYLIEDIINQWLEDNPDIEILNMSQETNKDKVKISFCYKEN